MACVLGLVKDVLPALSTVNRYGCALLAAALDGAADRAHRLAARTLGDGEALDDCESVSGASTVACYTESAVHRLIDSVGIMIAGLQAWKVISCGMIQGVADLLERRGVRGGVSIRLALGREASKALRLARQTVSEFVSGIPEELGCEDLIGAGRALALLQAATARKPVAAQDEMRLQLDGGDDGELQVLAEYLGWALATYGRRGTLLWRALEAVGATGRTPPSTQPPEDDAEAIRRLTDCNEEEDVLVSELHSCAFRPAFLLGVHRSRRTLVLSLRGSWHPVDLLTDLDCKPVAVDLLGQHGHAHRGILQAARKLDAELKETVRAALTARPGLTLVLTGHSLGGSVASVLAMLWGGPRFAVDAGDSREMRCYVYGPAGTVTLPLAHAASTCVTAVVNAQDMVPRLSFASVTNLRAALVALAREGRGPASPAPASPASPASSAAPSSSASEAGDGLVSRVIERLGGRTSLSEEDMRWAESILVWLRTTNEELYVEELLPAGRVLWVPPEEPKPGPRDDSPLAPCGADENQDPQGVATPSGWRRRLVHCANASFCSELQLGLSMLMSHAPLAYAHALRLSIY